MLDFAVFGTNFGEIYAFRFESLIIDKNRLLEFKYDRASKSEMAISKGVDALTTCISSLDVYENKTIFVTGFSDQCILQYRIDFEEQEWELDFNGFFKDSKDPFGEIPSYPDFMALISEIWHQRMGISEIIGKID